MDQSGRLESRAVKGTSEIPDLSGETEKIFVFLNGESKGALSPPAAEI
jgi:hypothetical protein